MRVINMRPRSGVLSHAVEDRVPPGFVVSGISHGGTFETTSRKVKWGPYFDGAVRSLTYEVVGPGNPSVGMEFGGVASFDGVDVPVADPAKATSASTAGFTGRDRLRRLPSGEVELRWTAEIGQSYRIEATDNLTEWKELTTVTADMTDIRFVDREGPRTNQRFYRIQRETSGK